jgi:STIP1 family protein 1
LENWTKCQEDSQKAIEFDVFHQNTKAFYLLGLSLKMFGKYEEAMVFFDKALQISSSKMTKIINEKNTNNKKLQEEIWIEWRRTNKQKWLQFKKKEQFKKKQAKQIIQNILKQQQQQQQQQVIHSNSSSTTTTTTNSTSSTSSINRMNMVDIVNMDEIVAYLYQMLETHDDTDTNNTTTTTLHGKIPEYFICPVSMDLMMDPVTTPNGVS